MILLGKFGPESLCSICRRSSSSSSSSYSCSDTSRSDSGSSSSSSSSSSSISNLSLCSPRKTCKVYKSVNNKTRTTAAICINNYSPKSTQRALKEHSSLFPCLILKYLQRGDTFTSVQYTGRNFNQIVFG